MSFSAEIKNFQEKEVIVLTAGKYKATIAPFLGSNVSHLIDTELGLDFFRNDDTRSIEEMKASPEVYGFPTLLYPNRLHEGKLTASDYTYTFPITDVDGNNHLHGFLHKREHSIVTAEVVGESAVAKTEYVYDEKDPFFSTFPVSFVADFTFTLSEDGLFYELTITNTSDRQLPYGVCNHTAMNGPFKKDAKALDTRMYLPVSEKWELDKNCIPTLSLLPFDNRDKQYVTGSLIPVEQNIDNDVFTAAVGDLDGVPFHGCLMTDTASGAEIIYEVDDNFKFWVVWNDGGDKGYFCPEPSTWMIDAPNLAVPADESGYLELAPGESKTVQEKFSSRLAK